MMLQRTYFICLHYEQVKISLFDIVQLYSVQINANVHLELVAKPKGLNKKEGALLETRDSRGTRVGIRNVGPCDRARTL